MPHDKRNRDGHDGAGRAAGGRDNDGRQRTVVVSRSAERPVFLNAPEAAAWLRVSPVTLSRWRIAGSGPKYKKFGRRVVYAYSDLVTWTEAQTRLSTSETDHRAGSQG